MKSMIFIKIGLASLIGLWILLYSMLAETGEPILIRTCKLLYFGNLWGRLPQGQ